MALYLADMDAGRRIGGPPSVFGVDWSYDIVRDRGMLLSVCVWRLFWRLDFDVTGPCWPKDQGAVWIASPSPAFVKYSGYRRVFARLWVKA